MTQTLRNSANRRCEAAVANIVDGATEYNRPRAVIQDENLIARVTRMLHELWVCPDGLDTFCLAGPKGDEARILLQANSKKVWTVDANCHFDAMTKYFEYRAWGEYKTDFPEQDKAPY